MTTKVMAHGSYSYIPGVMQYSAGVAAIEGYALVRAKFGEAVPLGRGFELIKSHLQSVGRPVTAFCGCELRSPGQFTEEGFEAFNRLYVGTLRDWGIVAGDDNPVARSNVCPEFDPPKEPSFHAFTYTVEKKGAAASFVIAGSAEAPEGKGNYRDHIVSLGDRSSEGLRAKASFVLDEMERRMAYFGGRWSDVTNVHVYSIHDIHPLIAAEFGPRGAARTGLTWFYNRPPVVDLEFEMDCRSVNQELVIPAA